MLTLPDSAIQRIAGPPVEIDGRVLNRSVQLLLNVGERIGRDSIGGGDVHRKRAETAQMARLGMPLAKGVHVADRRIPGAESTIAARVYRPFGIGAVPPAIVYYHGGGFVIGDLDSHDGSCRMLAIESGCVVIAVDYRLAPEHPFPAAPDDCIAAYQWVVGNAAELSIDPMAVAVMGDSAGGNLAAVVAQATRDADVPPPVAQGLVYPTVDARMATRSIELFAEGFGLTRESMDWFLDHYLPRPEMVEDPRASPMLADDLTGVAPAWVWTAGFDPLRDEGRAYAERLRKAEVTTFERCYDDQVHAFFSMGVVPGGLDIIAEVSRNMGELVRTSAAARAGGGRS